MTDDKPLSFTMADLKTPKLRRCTFDVDTIDWRRARLLGAGLDGAVWRVFFGDKGPYALKLFWDAGVTYDISWYWAAQRECQNAALLQMLRASLDWEGHAGKRAQGAQGIQGVQAVQGKQGEQAEEGDQGEQGEQGDQNKQDKPPGTVLVHANPQTHEDALSNLMAFSLEAKQRNQTNETSQSVPPSQVQHQVQSQTSEVIRLGRDSMPRFAQFHGWLRVDGIALVRRMPLGVFPAVQVVDKHKRYVQDLQELKDWKVEVGLADAADELELHYAIVYEYVESGGMDKERARVRHSKTWQGQQRAKAKAEAEAKEALAVGVETRNQRAQREALAARQKEQKEKQRQERLKEDQQQEHDRVAAVARFLHLAGISFCPQSLACNWKNGVLIDHSDIISPRSYGWAQMWYRIRSVEKLLAE
ncbi:uncharacterized protein SPSK_04307 [Sporothrix schenckii 1099-18]|uniref:Protein kinase domain-containing protein n=2 Tax=Sporothrix schenckii TaxID=29908 RepID=U7PT59_SPOS1|nr:uncharacterized protein SPSK_04307 [Sporothrix schenckii 1099-18]ERS98797.1 hypothetical protein HMPREF1624_03987 [Sporothrix schenckii ATCC 58251]KJR83604.1 hypothetical protein SPSK_04307 [Sporothrix schenckii 1099-18]